MANSKEVGTVILEKTPTEKKFPATVLYEKSRITPDEPLEFVKIPLGDVYGYKFPEIRINDLYFQRGVQYEVGHTVAEELRRIIEARMSHDRRLMNTQIDLEALAAVAKEGTNAQMGIGVISGAPGAIFGK